MGKGQQGNIQNITIHILDKSAQPFPYTGQLYKLRPFVKWVLILYLIVNVLISSIILKEQPIQQALLSSAAILAICTAWLIKTMTHWELKETPLDITFTEESLILNYSSKQSVGKGNKIQFRRERYTFPKDSITSIKLHNRYKRIEVYGSIRTDIWNQENIDGAPDFTKYATKAAWSFYPEDYNESGTTDYILELLSEYTGKQAEIIALTKE